MVIKFELFQVELEIRVILTFYFDKVVLKFNRVTLFRNFLYAVQILDAEYS